VFFCTTPVSRQPSFIANIEGKIDTLSMPLAIPSAYPRQPAT
jgi:hypothetical protein